MTQNAAGKTKPQKPARHGSCGKTAEHPNIEQRVMHNDPRPLPGGESGDPMCVNYGCPSSFSCRRFSWEPYQGSKGTIFIDGEPRLLNGLLCESFDPAWRFFPPHSSNPQRQGSISAVEN